MTNPEDKSRHILWHPIEQQRKNGKTKQECFGTSSLVLYGVNLRKRDLFVTNARMEVLNDVGGSFNYQTSWEDDVVTELTAQLKVVNELK